MLTLLLVALPILLGVQGFRTYDAFGFAKEVGPNKPEGCFLLDSESGLGEGTILPVEDLVQYRPGILIGGAGGVIEGERFGPESRPQGHMLAVDARKDGSKPVVRKLKMTKFTPEVRFLPHGIFYSDKTERLYVINHAGTSSVGSRIEVFDVTEGDDGIPELAWRTALGGPDVFPNVAINSVIEGDGDEIYVTQWQSAPVPVKGSHHPETIMERAGRAVHDLGTALVLPGNQGVYRCTFDANSPADPKLSCSTASWGFVAANGITATKDLSRIFVVDVVAHKIYVYARDPKNGALNLLSNETITTPDAPDNVHIDYETGDLYTGTLHRLKELLIPSGSISGSFQVFSRSSPTSRYDQVELRVEHDGSMLSQISACMPVSGASKSWSVCGSPLSNGLLVCPAA